ncbi:hypothetical protein [Cypionkella psychrotolerans]|uniref:hypothetical protein n=1 Tax=Cypionkella psychrotolerans TaxID=1678131 RepID=UPI0006B67BF9|nr:hypothetical protein [Cypionkella psychrotolerans]
MKDSEFSHMPYRNVVLVGVGTVFGTLGVILLAMLGEAVVWPVDPDTTLDDLLRGLLLYAIVGGMIASGICVVLVAPMLLLWDPVFILFRRRGYALPQAAMASAGVLSFLATLGILVSFEWMERPLPLVGWPFVSVPVIIAVFLARYFSFVRSGAVWE